MEFDFDTDYFSDTTAWVVSLIMYFLFMGMIWFAPDMFGGKWNPMHKILITILALPVLYVVAKWRLDK